MNVDKYSDDYKVEDSRSSAELTGGDSRCPTVGLLYSPPSLVQASHEHSIFSRTSTEDGDLERTSETKKNNGRRTSSFALSVRDHVKMGSKLSETVKGKLRLGAKIIQKGGRENIFKEVFEVFEGEKLLKASQCYLSTTGGPIAGLLFISTQKLAFCSDRSIRVPSSNGNGELVRKPYKVLIPISKIKDANERENVENPAQKYIQITTNDNFEFWFMGFVRYEKAFHNLRKALSIAAK